MFGLLCVTAGTVCGLLDFGADKDNVLATCLIPLVAYFQILGCIIALDMAGVI